MGTSFFGVGCSLSTGGFNTSTGILLDFVSTNKFLPFLFQNELNDNIVIRPIQDGDGFSISDKPSD